MTEVKKEKLQGLEYDEEGFRISTPPQIAAYKAERLATDNIADLGAGNGVQSLYFARISKRVISVDNDEERIVILRNNAKKEGIANIEFILGDALEGETIKKVGDVNIVNSDPSRKRGGRKWEFTYLSPNPLNVVEKYRSDGFSFDLPPLMPISSIPEDWEIEYLSLYGELKRMLAYVGGAKKFERSALTLPSRKRIVFDHNIERNVNPLGVALRYIYDLDSSLLVSDLIPEFMHHRDLWLLHSDSQRVLMTSEKLAKDPFLFRTYSVLDTALTLATLKQKLSTLKAGKVFIRFPIEPSNYYVEKRNFERGLNGIYEIYLFKVGEVFYLASKVS
jgi:SAM-dependent methyltransferase